MTAQIPQYLVFAGDDYYPSGGAGDFRASYETLEQAIMGGPRGDWTHVATWDDETFPRLKIVKEWRNGTEYVNAPPETPGWYDPR